MVGLKPLRSKESKGGCLIYVALEASGQETMFCQCFKRFSCSFKGAENYAIMDIETEVILN